MSENKDFNKNLTYFLAVHHHKGLNHDSNASVSKMNEIVTKISRTRPCPRVGMLGSIQWHSR